MDPLNSGLVGVAELLFRPADRPPAPPLDGGPDRAGGREVAAV